MAKNFVNSVAKKVSQNPVAFSLTKKAAQTFAFSMTPVFRYLPIKWPEIISGPTSIADLAGKLKSESKQRAVVVIDNGLFKFGMHEKTVEELEKVGISTVVFSEIYPDPNFETVQAGIDVCKAHDFDCIIAIGGGSAMDATKVINVCATFNKAPHKAPGLFKFRKPGKTFAAIPTTAGTGSEVTMAAVLTDTANHRKLPVADTCLLPQYAVMDPNLLTGLPPHITAHTGMDALTHAVEAYISRYATEETDENGIEAVKLIFKYLEKSYIDGKDLEAREHMLNASHLAGRSFTKANVGYVHAIAHNLGGLYHTPHGEANAMFLSAILEFSLPSCTDRLANLGRVIGVATKSTSDRVAAESFVKAVQDLSAALDIPTKLAALKEEDIPNLAYNMITETYTTPYGVPRYFENQEELEDILRKFLP